MAAEGALLVSTNLGSCGIDPTFTAQVEQRNVKEVSAVEASVHSNNFTIVTEYGNNSVLILDWALNFAILVTVLMIINL